MKSDPEAQTCRIEFEQKMVRELTAECGPRVMSVIEYGNGKGCSVSQHDAESGIIVECVDFSVEEMLHLREMLGVLLNVDQNGEAVLESDA